MYNNRDRGPPTKGLIRKGIRGLASGVGLASESIKAHKESKAQERASMSRTTSEASQTSQTSNRSVENYETPSAPPPSYSQVEDSKAGPSQYPNEKKSGGLQDEGEVDAKDASLDDEWNLDDAQDEVYYGSSEKAPAYDSVFAPSSSGTPPADTEALEDTFIRTHPIPRDLQGNPTPVGRLPLTVVLPQRRPKDRSRGFIRAYAPMLENCGIDQATWLSFLDTFQKSSAANPWLNAINMASFATFALPHPIGIAVGYAIGKITDAAIEVHARHR
jgi:hypothetical protein